MLDGVLFVERSDELWQLARLSAFEARSRSESESEQGDKSVVIDPKPGDLSMSRLKVR